MKTCHECGLENEDTTKFCKYCGINLNKSIKKAEIITFEKPRKLKRLIYKNDERTNQLRLSKNKIISDCVFLFFTLFALSLNELSLSMTIASIISGLIFSVPVYIIGWITGWIIRKIK